MYSEIQKELKSHQVITRYSGNPVLTSDHIPYPSALVFNPGVTKYLGRYIMVFRNDYGAREKKRLDGTNLGLAFSDNGINWEITPEPFFTLSDEDIRWVNDPRLTVIDSRCYITFAIIGRSGVRGGIAVTEDFKSCEILYFSLPDNRNLVLFPEKIASKYIRLDRPFANYLRKVQNRFDIWISKSPDLVHWGDHQLLLKAENVPFSNERIGAGPPPVKTIKGWLQLFHAVDVDPARGKNGWEDRWDKRYTVGVMLLDLNQPHKIIGFSPFPIMVPEKEYELSGGFRNNVIFPSGMILEESGEVKIYYGASDTMVCLATAQIDDLLALCLDNKQ
jgi:beta-1,4-mannooligosaccharide/beta-1,4-mannosyl-N-acetylglucosamine phosphorylase